MNRNTGYSQCTLRRQHAKGWIVTTSFIPQQYAKLGQMLKLKDDDGFWVDGWIVENVGISVLEASDLPDSHKAIKNHRKSTGDSIARRKN